MNGNSQLRLHVIVASTRPGRIGPVFAQWFRQIAQQDPRFEVHLVDLADINLPVYDEPKHPTLQRYEHEHTEQWSTSVASADAFVFVTPEYNYFPPPALVNALDYVYKEWNYKPAAFVSYGGQSGGIRAIQALKLLVTTLKMMPILESVSVFKCFQYIDGGTFNAEQSHNESATALLDETYRWARALRNMRLEASS